MIVNRNIANSELNCLISPEIKNDEFYTALHIISREENIKTILEIGSSSGEGSTEAFVTGIRENTHNKPNLFCIEVSKTRFTELQNRYKEDLFVKCYNYSSISSEHFPDENEIIDFYKNIDNNLRTYPLDIILTWLKQDIEYVKQSNIDDNGIKKIKQENNIEFFDVVLIDGSEFTGNAELKEVYGAKYIFLDDTNSFKNYYNFQQLVNDTNYILIKDNPNLRNGYALFKKITVQPLSYTTIHAAVESIQGFMMPGQEEYLFNKVKSLPEDAIIVEIGSFKGRSTVAMGYACVGTKRKIYSIDTWNGNDSDFSERQFFETWQQSVQINSLEEYVVPLCGYSHDILSRWQELTDGKAIDFIFIDGSHQYLDVLKDFEMSYPLVKDGGWMAFHDVIHTWIGPERVWYRTAKFCLVNHEYSSSLACGQKNLTSISSLKTNLPIHFFTIVLNGKPFINYHIDVLKLLPFKWHWHIVEGVADLKHDTAWTLQLGGSIYENLHNNGRSNDGTTKYLDELAQLYPENITIYRKPEGVFWDGKREMVNAPLANINEECLLWQVDVDELWTVEQICTAREMFISNPEKTAAFYWCWYFVGENLVISTRNCYTQNPQQEWLRTWRFQPGFVWATHEPPILIEPTSDGQLKNIAAINPFVHSETEQQGLIFQHFAYATEEQLQFKEHYYGYKNAVLDWKSLQNMSKFPVLLRDYFSWVRDETLVNTANACGIIPIAQKKLHKDSWRFLKLDDIEKGIYKTKKSVPIIIIDGVFFQIRQSGIARVWKSLLKEWANNEFGKHILVLDRAGTAPKIPGLRYRTIPAYDYKNTNADKAILQQVCDEEGAELFISSYYTTPIKTPSIFMSYDMTPEAMGWDLNNSMWQEKHHGIRHASAYIAISEHTARDLSKYFPEISFESVTVAHCGVEKIFSPAIPEKINAFKIKYGISKPYFLLVGIIGSNKNTHLFFKAFAQLSNSSGFDIVCTGSSDTLTPELRTYTSGSAVHTLELSDEELVIAYSGAVALVYPSKYEGFGMPIVEAMACGCPVITCPNASIPEVAGKAAIYVNDNDIEAMANALCEVQKPNIRNTLIATGLKQAKQFSWSQMADTVSTALINTTLLSLNLKEVNYIIFPDWSQSEEVLGLELQEVIKNTATYANSYQTTLLIDITSINLEEAELFLSSVTMNLLMNEEFDGTEELEISFLGELSDIQWKALRPRINSVINLKNQNHQAFNKFQSILQEINTLDTIKTNGYSIQNVKYISDIIAKYNQGYSQLSITNELRDLRTKMAEYWLSVAENQLEKVYAGKISEGYQAIVKSGIQNQELTESEHKFVNEVMAKVTKRLDESKAIQYLLVAMLYSLPQQLPLLDATCIPSWLLNDYLQFTLQSPLYFQQVGEADSYYQYLENWVNYLHHNIVNNSASQIWHEVGNYFTQIANFIPLYFNNFNLKDIYTKRADIIYYTLNKLDHQTEYEFSELKSKNTKIRLGILAAHFAPQTETFAALPVYKHLNRDLFEIVLFTLNVSNHRLERYCLGHADELVQLPEDLASQVQVIREADLDILFIATNITAVTHNITLLASHRLARIQIVDANSPVSTGMRHIDYYISSKLSEPEENAQQHYTETLIKLDCPPQCFDFATEENIIPTTSISKENIGISDNNVVYISGANYYKIIPELEETWAKIISNVPNSILVLYPFNPNWSSSYPSLAFQKRIVKTFAKYGLGEDRLIILDPAPNRADVKERLQLGDIYLDSYPYSGMTSLIDPLEVGLTTVVMEAESSRSKKGASLLRELQMSDLIADSEESYIKLAVNLGKNPELRQQKSTEIQEKMQNNPSFLDSRSYSAKMGNLFQEIFQNYQINTLNENFRLRDINLIIFPDWNQPEESIGLELQQVIKTLATHPDTQKTTLLIDTSNITVEDAEMFLSSVAMNLLMEEDVDITEELAIALVGELSDTQCQALLPRIQARIILKNENQVALTKLSMEKLPLCRLESFQPSAV